MSQSNAPQGRRRPWLRLVLTLGLLALVVLTIIVAQLRENTLRIANNRDLPLIDAAVTIGPPGRDLLVIRQRDGATHVVYIQADGTQAVLTADRPDTHHIVASWAFDGQTINVLSNRANPAEFGPLQVDLLTGEVRELSIVGAIITLFRERQFHWGPQWSPDGHRLAWSSLRDANLELYTIPTDAPFEMTSATRLTSRAARDWFPAWSPDGARLAFVSNVEGSEDIYTLDLATGTTLRHTDFPLDELPPVWSSDGQRLLFWRQRQDVIPAQPDLFVLTLADNHARPLTVTDVFRGGEVWASGGDRVAYVSNETGSFQVYVMNADGGGLRQVTDGEGDYLFPTWRP